MLKKRIKSWDLDRNHKQADMLYALRLAFQREAQDKKTIFRIRGRIITFRDIEQYFRRKGVHDLQSHIANTSAAAPTTRIDCRTPEPDNAIYNPESLITAQDLSLHHDLENISCDNNSDIVTLLDPDTVLRQLDQILHLGRNHYKAVFENPDWRTKVNISGLASLKRFYHYMSLGQLLLERSRIADAFEHFTPAFDLIHDILNKQILLFLPYLFDMAQRWRTRRQEVLCKMLGFISQMIQQCYPQLRPMQYALTLLQHMSAEDRGECSSRVCHSIFGHLIVEYESESGRLRNLLGAPRVYELCAAPYYNLNVCCYIATGHKGCWNYTAIKLLGLLGVEIRASAVASNSTFFLMI